MFCHQFLVFDLIFEVYRTWTEHKNVFLIPDLELDKVGRIYPMVISSKFHMGQYRDDYHLGYAHHFSI